MLAQNLLNRIDTEYTKDEVDELAKLCPEFRKLIIKFIEYRIEELQCPMVNFDIENYGLKRSFKDGGIYHLNKLKEVIDD